MPPLVEEWLLHPHPGQSGSVVYLTDGNATGVAAASDYSQYGIEYLICANMTMITPADNPACSVDVYISENKCCNCTKAPCWKDLDLMVREGEATDSEGLGLHTIGCTFSTSTEQRLLFFARRNLEHVSTTTVYQLIGFTDVEKEPTSASATSFSKELFIGSVVGAGSGVAVISTLICVIVFGVMKVCRSGECFILQLTMHCAGPTVACAIVAHCHNLVFTFYVLCIFYIQ